MFKYFQGEEKEALLKKLRARLGNKGGKEPAPGTNAKVLWQGANKSPSIGGAAPKAAAETPKAAAATPKAAAATPVAVAKTPVAAKY